MHEEAQRPLLIETTISDQMPKISHLNFQILYDLGFLNWRKCVILI